MRAIAAEGARGLRCPVMRKRIVLVMLGLWLAACGRGTPAPTGEAGTQPPPVAQVKGARVVSTVPAATLNLVLMGAADQVVGVSKYDKLYLPLDKQDLPV